MITDARTLGEGETIEADVCIVGAGPAGITLARQLAGRGDLRILILESGGLEPDPAAQALCQGTCVGDEYGDLTKIRARGFSGTANIWVTPVFGTLGAKYVPLDPIDFERRDWIPHSGWPFDYHELEPWYLKAQNVCGLGPFRYDAASWATESESPWPLDGTDVQSGVYQLGKGTVFRRDAADAVRQADNITCLLFANATEIELDATGRTVARLRFAGLPGPKLKAAASIYVLAGGAIENARLMLASNRVHAAGIGNQHDLVGRYYMDHPVYLFTELVPFDSRWIGQSGFYDMHEVGGARCLGRFGLSRLTLEREKLLNVSAIIYPRPARYRSRGIEAIRDIRMAVRRGKRPVRLAPSLLSALIGLPDILAYAINARNRPTYMAPGWPSRNALARGYRTFEPEFYLEQAPNPDNRVMLGTELDGAGVPKPVIHWRWGDLDRRSVERAREIFDAAFRRAGIGRLDKLANPVFQPSGHHSAGTTRMSRDPRQGVVDEHCRVHGLANLFVAGSSVFPTAGYANPMLTIVAISMRLADHLGGRI